jgi:MFS family permease
MEAMMGELSAGRRQLVLIICCMSLFIVGIDVTIVNVALPSIQRDFHASVSDLQWTICDVSRHRGHLNP